MRELRAFNFKKWIDEHRHLLEPPVGNKLVRNCLPLWVDQGDGGVVGSTKD